MTTDLKAKLELRSSFLWRVGAAAGGMVSTLLLTVVAVRTLNHQEAATFFAILAALSFGSKIGCLGMGPNVVRLVAAQPDAAERRKTAGTHLRATFLLSCLTAPVIAFIGCNGLFGHGNFLPALVMTTVLIVIESTRLMISDIFAAEGRVRASVATMHYVRSLVVLPFVIIAVYVFNDPSLLAVLGTYLAVAAVQFLVALAQVNRYASLFESTGGLATLRKAVKEGTQLFSLDLAEFMIMQGTIWLATATFPPPIATQYSAAVTLAMQVTIFESLAALAVVAPATRLWATGKKDEVIKMLSNAATLSTAVVVTIFIALLMLGSFVLKLAYGSGMEPAATMLVVLAAGGIVQVSAKRSVTVLIVSGEISAAARTATTLMLLTVPCAVVAAVYGGPIPLAVVTACGIAILAVGQFFTARRTLGLAPHANVNIIGAAMYLAHLSDSELDKAQPSPVTPVETPQAPTVLPAAIAEVKP
jgi:O-antigen/teichoic acid export membrane protein